MGYWDDLVEEEHECGGCGYTTKISRRQYYEDYGYEPGGRRPGYERGQELPRMNIKWIEKCDKFFTVYKKYFLIEFGNDPYFLDGTMKYYNKESGYMEYEYFSSDDVLSVKKQKQFIEETLADSVFSREMEENAKAFEQSSLFADFLASKAYVFITTLEEPVMCKSKPKDEFMAFAVKRMIDLD